MKTGTQQLVMLLVVGALALPGCRSSQHTASFKHLEGGIFATHYRITYLGDAAIDRVRAAVQTELERIDGMASTWKPESELMRYNRAEDKASFPLSAELSGLLQRAGEIKQWTDGAFDVEFHPGQIDLSAIAKGYAVDRITELLAREFGISSCLVDIGGEVRVQGDGPRGSHWNVGIYVPSSTGQPAIEPPRLELRNTSIATSGTYFKGRHIIDPHDGHAVQGDLISASVIHPSNTTADALATALYVMGAEQGMKWAEANKVHALFLLADGSILRNQPK